MKLLMIYADRFAYKTSKKTLETVEEYERRKANRRCFGRIYSS